MTGPGHHVQRRLSLTGSGVSLVPNHPRADVPEVRLKFVLVKEQEEVEEEWGEGEVRPVVRCPWVLIC